MTPIIQSESRTRRLQLHAPGSPLSSSFQKAFTLIEIVLVLTLVAIITAAAVPAVNGLRDEAAAREPLTALARLAKETRLQAMKDKRPYQIAFTAQGFTATRYLSPYLQAAELEAFLQTPVPDPVTEATESADGAPPPPTFVNWTKTYALPEGLQYNVQYWHEASPTEISGPIVRLWVFQPTGIVAPITVNLIHQGTIHSATFNALTADIAKTSSHSQ
ncbi:prepilin-type N-terminal cleavage/methylation domain-containing protein [Phragmitibacter flavus]|uniref:Prepilin-type N-terminal cleavage/methylation domain-containing protein n=1 Tax=Phragmitibacter flavus TaxID=2576071 RepID=A0A5R8KDB5_9BACT|nr:prepilin-type N-terminal cleavage/methylation domain-containing protein [Phragmitibacter flavus]TLD70291.1 prepilin-type N-terminal cleavage/methylation domain-containing protein [Phragmitibacter flavus]